MDKTLRWLKKEMEGDRTQRGSVEKYRWRHLGTRVLKENEALVVRVYCAFVPTGVHEINLPSDGPTTGNQITILPRKESISAHYIFLSAHKRLIIHLCVHHIVTELRVLWDFHYTPGVRRPTWIAYIRKRLRARRHAAAIETSAVSPKEDEFVYCERAQRASTIDLAGGVGWVFGGCSSQESQVSMSQTINGVLRQPHGDAFQGTREQQKGPDGKQSTGRGGSSISKGEGGPADWAFHVVISWLPPGNNFICVFFFYSSLSVSAYLLALPLCCSALQTTVISSTEILKIWGGENHLCIKVQKLNWFPKIYSSKVSNLQLRVFSPPLQTRWIFCPCSEWRAEQISTGD